MGRTRYQKGSLRPVTRKDGTKVWEFRWWATAVDGSRYRASEVLGTLAELKSEAAAQREADKRRVVINATGGKAISQTMTFAEIEMHYRAKEIPAKAATTQQSEKMYLDNWITPRWGKVKANAIRTIEVEEWLHSVPRTEGTRAKIRNIMSCIYSHAVRWEFVDRNPICGQGGTPGHRGASTGVRQSSKVSVGRIIIPAAEMQTIFGKLKLREQTMAILDAVTGLRQSELAGLKWMDVDWTRGEINSVRSVAIGKVRETTKTGNNASLPLAAAVLDMLREYRREVFHNRETDWIFAGSIRKGRMPLWLGPHFQRFIRPVIEEVIGVQDDPLGWHTFRRSLATLLVDNGENVKVVQDQLRHSNIRITLELYAQSTRPAQHAAHAKVVEMVLPKSMAHAMGN